MSKQQEVHKPKRIVRARKTLARGTIDRRHGGAEDVRQIAVRIPAEDFELIARLAQARKTSINALVCSFLDLSIDVVTDLDDDAAQIAEELARS